LDYYEFNEKLDNFNTVKLYLNDIGVDFGKDLMVPLFFDYGCKIECKNKWQSLNSDRSPECKYTAS
jgi:hypothetical protein